MHRFCGQHRESESESILHNKRNKIALVQHPVRLGNNHRLQQLAQHNNVSLKTLCTVVAVVKAILTPDAPAATRIATERDALNLDSLIQQLKVILTASSDHSLQCQFADPRRGQKEDAHCPQQNDQQYLAQTEIHSAASRLGQAAHHHLKGHLAITGNPQLAPYESE